MSVTTKEEQDKKNVDGVRSAGIVGGAAEVVQRYGSAVKEHNVAYSGMDNEAKLQLKKSLKSISKQKINPDYKAQNLKQQAGFSAEVKETANANAENIIKGSAKRKIRTDDLGRVNDPLYDHMETDALGNMIPGSGSQMKFVGATPEEAFKKLSSKEFSKYLENDAKLEVPSDFYDGILKEAETKISKLQKQADNQRACGNTETVGKIEKEIQDCKKIKENLRKSSLSNKEAMFARTHARLSTVKSVAKVSHRAGKEAGQSAFLIGGSVSIVQNMVAMVKGEVEAEDAIMNVAKDTATSYVVGYGTGFTGAIVKGVMQNASSDVIRAASRTNLPGVVVTVAISATKSLNRYFKGEITGVECFEELGEQGTGMVAASLFGTIGQVAIPIPVVGAAIGSMLGYAISSASYGTLMGALKEAQLAQEERLQIEEACREHIELMRTYRLEIEKVISEYLVLNMEIFHQSFDCIKAALEIGDIDGFITGTNVISETLGMEPQFQSMSEFEALMNSKNSFKL